MYFNPRKRKIQASIHLAKEKLVQAAHATSDDDARIAEEEACNTLAKTPITFTFFEILTKDQEGCTETTGFLKPHQDYSPLSKKTEKLFSAIHFNLFRYLRALNGDPEAIEEFEKMLSNKVTFEVAMINPDYMLDDMPRNVDALEDAQISYKNIKEHLTSASKSTPDISMRYIERALIALAHTRITPEFLQTMKTAEHQATATQDTTKESYKPSLLRIAALVHKDHQDLSTIFNYLVNAHKAACTHPQNISTLFNETDLKNKRFRVSDIKEITQSNIDDLRL